MDTKELETPEIVEQTTALERTTRGEIDMQVSTARKYPRSIERFKKDALSMATIDQDTAAACFYCVPRGGKSIEGPGVRLAEIIASCWGNLRSEARVVEEGDKFVTCKGTSWDMERNNLVSVEVRRKITDKNGRRYSDDMITTTANAASSIAFRNAVFKVVPNAYTKAVYEAARRVAVGDQRTLADRRGRCLDWFAKAGISQDRVFLAVNKSGIEDIDLKDLETLLGLSTAIQEGTVSIDEAFPQSQELKSGDKKFGFEKKKEIKKEEKETKKDDEFNYGPPPIDERDAGSDG